MSNSLILTDIHKSFTQGGRTLDILKGISLTLEAGTVTALVGQSGAGKSTLLQIAGLLDDCDSGVIELDGVASQHLGAEARAAIRAQNLGFIYQFHHLLPDFSALENVMMPLLILGESRKKAKEKAAEFLGQMGLEDRVDHSPAKLSGGEKQRVAIARALVHRPKVLLADEPTGNLDEETGGRVLKALLDIVEQTGVAALIATHDRAMAKTFDRTLELSHGHLHLVE